MKIWKQGQFVMTKEPDDVQWAQFVIAAKAQAAIDDCVAQMFFPDVPPSDWIVLDRFCFDRYGQSLGCFYNQCRKVGRAEFMTGQAAAAGRTAGGGAWFGEKVLGIEGGTDKAEPVTVLIDV